MTKRNKIILEKLEKNIAKWCIKRPKNIDKKGKYVQRQKK